MHNQVVASKEFGLVAAVFYGQLKFIVTRASAVVHNGTVHYVKA